jgi:Domain of unknown function (DUF4338)
MDSFKNQQEQYDEWLRINPTKLLDPSEMEDLDDDLRTKIIEELNITADFEIQKFMLKHKYDEIRRFVSSQNIKEIHQIKDNIWKPSSIDSYKDISPELILVSDTCEIPKITIWGEEVYETYYRDEKLVRVWNILRTMIASSRNDGVIGRSLKILVVDKTSKKYLGILNIASSMMFLTPRNQYLFGNSNDLYNRVFSQGGRSKNMACGTTIMTLQPFGRLFNGGKLMSLLCLSDEVCKMWEQKYGDKLVCFETTSLFGDKKLTQYDGLQPYIRKLGLTSGETPLKPSDDLWKSMRRWLKLRFPEIYHHYLVETNEKGQPASRYPKDEAIKKVYKLLSISKYLDINSGFKRGVYFSRLYKNSDEFIRYEINESDLVPAFDNSVETLTEFWKYGFEKNIDSELKTIVNGRIKHSTKNSSAKQRVNRIKDYDELSSHLPSDWYEELKNINWNESINRYLTSNLNE